MDNPESRAWIKHKVESHKNPDYSIVQLSLKAPGDASGNLSAKAMEAVAITHEQYSLNELRASCGIQDNLAMLLQCGFDSVGLNDGQIENIETPLLKTG